VDKREVRSRQNELRTLLNEWDPIGVSPGSVAPADEYDCLLPILGWLQRGMTERELADRVSSELVDHFGLDPAPLGCADFAERVFAWYWRDPLPGSDRPET
jgi:hypothetical protein